MIAKKMKLTCEVQVLNRLLPTLNIRKSGKSAFTQLSIGRKPGDRNSDGPIFLLLCTQLNRSGTKYLLSKNVQQIFSRFVKEGKATIRLSNPSDDIVLSKAEPIKLASFIKLIREASAGRMCQATSLSSLAPASAKDIEKPVLNLVVTMPSQYPMAFPNSLQQLTINGCSLRRISTQITSLLGLRKLDLTGNNISSIPEALSHLNNLHTVILGENSLAVFPQAFLQGFLPNSLAVLDLRKNSVEELPHDITKMTSLQSLNLNSNKIKKLPESMALMKQLHCIYVADNLLECLPGSLLTRMFEKADFSGNPFKQQQSSKQPSLILPIPVPSLAEWAARTIIWHRIHYTEEDLDIHSIKYLKNVHFCQCRKPCFTASLSRLCWKQIPSATAYSEGDVPFLVYYCSMTCFRRL